MDKRWLENSILLLTVLLLLRARHHVKEVQRTFKVLDCYKSFKLRNLLSEIVSDFQSQPAWVEKIAQRSFVCPSLCLFLNLEKIQECLKECVLGSLKNETPASLLLLILGIEKSILLP